jgi:hypothetical protein
MQPGQQPPSQEHGSQGQGKDESKQHNQGKGKDKGDDGDKHGEDGDQ